MDEKKLMEETKRAIETEKLIARTKPYPRPSKDRLETLITHNFTQVQTNKMTSIHPDHYGIRINQVTAPKHCSRKRLDELEPIRLRDMLVNQIHKGKYLLCRIVGAPFYITAMTMVVEDEDGETEIVSAYNYTKSYDVDPVDVLPLNTVIAIKEPYLKIMISDNSNFYIRIESPTDIVILDEHIVAKWKTAEPRLLYDQLNDLGNKSFVTKDYYQAVRHYTKALKVIIRCKRAPRHIRIEQLHISSSRCSKRRSRTPPSEKAYYRAGRAAYSMRQYSVAAENFRKCLEINEKNARARQDLARSEERLRESSTGVYDMKRIINEVKSGKTRLDVADYVTSSMRVADVAGKSKGFVATEKIKRGTLVLASKAASIAYDSECKTKVISPNFYTKKMDQPSHNQNLSQVFFKLQHDPHLAKRVYEFYAGPDIDRNQQMLEGIVDSTRVELVLTYNSFVTQNEKDLSDGSAASRHQQMHDNSGFWLDPCYFNHSCVPNTKRQYLQDFVMFYALEDIEPGDELTTQYVGMSKLEQREKVCEDFGFKCRCVVCEMDRSDVNLVRREKLFAKNEKIISSLGNVNEAYVLKHVQMVKNTYEPSQKYRPGMSIPMMTLANFYRRRGEAKKAAETFMQTFEILKDCDPLFSGMLLIDAVKSYLQCGLKREASDTLKVAKEYFVGSIEYLNYAYEINDFRLP